jgi:cell division protein FtsB
MARNRKNESDLRVAPILLTVFLCALFAGLGVGYVWYKNQIDVLGHQITDREQRLAELQRRNKMRREQLATLCSPVALEERVKKLNLGLEQASLTQIIRLVDSPDYQQPAQPRVPTPTPAPPAKVALAARKN